jgi:hypothetical protein
VHADTCRHTRSPTQQTTLTRPRTNHFPPTAVPGPLPRPCLVQHDDAMRAAVRLCDTANGKALGGSASLWRGIAIRLLALESCLGRGDVVGARQVLAEAVGADVEHGEDDPVELERVSVTWRSTATPAHAHHGV